MAFMFLQQQQQKEGIINSSRKCFLSIIVLLSDIQPPFYYILHFLNAVQDLKPFFQHLCYLLMEDVFPVGQSYNSSSITKLLLIWLLVV